MSEIRQPDLRPYQADCVQRIRLAFALGYLRVLFVLPTGGGKTVIFAYITPQAAAKGYRVIILAHRQEIADQISMALWQMGVPHGRIQPDRPMTDLPVQVAMVQTLARRLDTIPEPQLLVIDEAHHAVAGTWEKILAAWPKARVLGVTATPERRDGRGLGDVFQHMVLGPDVGELIEAGYLAPYRYFAPALSVDLSGVRSVGGDFVASDLEDALDTVSITGDVVKHYLSHLGGRTAIAFCATVAHAEHVAQQFRDSGIASASIDGTMQRDRRHGLVNALRSGSIRVLTSCDLISEGFDVPSVGGVILLRPTKSFALHRQQVGRALRPKQDGSHATILDHVENISRHGLPDDPHAWSLDSKRRGDTEKEATECLHRTCRACNGVFSAGAGRDQCPTPGVDGCLFPPPRELEQREGELEEVAATAWTRGIDLRDVRGTELRRLVEAADGDPVKLRQIQQAKGYKPGWVYYAAMDAAFRRGGAR
jgi:superfamily II DNA or RNA helicase